MWCALLFINRLLQTLVLRYTKGDGKSLNLKCYFHHLGQEVQNSNESTREENYCTKIDIQVSAEVFAFLTFFSFLASRKHTKNKQISQKFKRLSFFLFAFKILVYRNRRAKGKSLVQRQAVGLKDKINFGNKKGSFTANTERRELHISHPHPKQHLLFEQKVQFSQTENVKFTKLSCFINKPVKIIFKSLICCSSRRRMVADWSQLIKKWSLFQ